MQKVKYSQLFYPGHFSLELNKPFFVQSGLGLLGVVTLVQNHIGINLVNNENKRLRAQIQTSNNK